MNRYNLGTLRYPVLLVLCRTVKWYVYELLSLYHPTTCSMS